jgi:hypothetical protein
MKRRVAITFTAVLLGLGFWTMTALSAQDEEKKAAQEAVLKLAETIKNGGNVQGQIAAIAKKFDELEPIMWVYKPRKKGGIGMGQGGVDDMEITIGKISGPKFRMTPQKLAAMKDDLIKVGELSKAVAAISEQDKYVQQHGKKDTAKWKKYATEMKRYAEELIEAAKSDSAAKVKAAARKLSDNCTSCHSDFRD